MRLSDKRATALPGMMKPVSRSPVAVISEVTAHGVSRPPGVQHHSTATLPGQEENSLRFENSRRGKGKCANSFILRGRLFVTVLSERASRVEGSLGRRPRIS